MNDSQLYLLSNVEIDADNEFTIDFDSATAQQAYFQSKISDVLDTTGDFSYIRKDADVKVEKSLEDLLSVNYLMFKNDSKWWYARITNKEYISPTTTRIYFEIDAFQTFMFDFEIQESFIDREHQDRWEKQSDGTLKPIYNLIPENLEIGDEYVVNETKYLDKTSEISTDNQLFYLIKAREKLGKDFFPVSSSHGNIPNEDYGNFANVDCKVGDVRTGIYLYLLPVENIGFVKIHRPGSSEYNRSVWAEKFYSIESMFEDSRIISITLIRYLPKFYEGMVDNDSETGGRTFIFNENNVQLGFCAYDKNDGYHLLIISEFDENEEINQSINLIEWRNIDFGTIETPISHPNINNEASIEYESKIKTSPFSFIRLGYCGESKDFKYEDFYSNINFTMYYGAGITGSTFIVPNDYNGSKNFSEKFSPIPKLDLTLRTDAWNEYIMNNKASVNGGLAVSAFQAIAGIGLSFATGGLGLAVAGSTVLGFGGQIANEMLKRQDIKNQPDDVRANSGDTEIINATTRLYIKLQKIGIKEQFKNNCYKYFVHYGYKANTFKKPDYRSRYYFNYIKTIGVNIKSNIDSIYVNELKSMFNNGVTIWHYRDSTTWKGTNNYDYENAEMNLISTEVENG